jgi:metallophosphoesterase superfamily enzyme
MLISFIKNDPALVVKREKVLVVGDLHIGLNLKYREAGLHFQNATEKLARNLLRLCSESHSKEIIILGDVKESIAYPKFGEYIELKRFFETMKGMKIKIAKGNHDGDLAKVLENIEADVEIKKEIIMDGVALVHGNAWPSEEAMRKKYLISAHGHFAIEVNGRNEKAWIVARTGKGIGKKYERYNEKIKLVVVPPFNDLILGTRIGERTAERTPLFRQEVFDWKSSKIYDLRGNKFDMENVVP